VDFAREPPHNLDAEKSTLGGVLVKPAVLDAVSVALSVDDFMMPAHREVFAAMLALRGRRLPVDVLSVGDELKSAGVLGRLEGGQAYLIELAKAVPTAENVGHYARIVREKATLRRLIALAAEVQSAALGNQPVDEVLALAREGVAALGLAGQGKGPQKLESLLGGALDEIEARQRGERPVGVMTGLRQADRLLRGLKPARLHILAGRPGDGKTSLALDIALYASTHGVPALVFEREMQNQELVEGVLSRESGIPAYDITGGRLDLAAWKKLQGAAGKVLPAELWLDEDSSTIDRIVSVTRHWHAANCAARNGQPQRLGIMVLDYLQLTRVLKARNSATREQVVAEMSRALKELAKELGIPVLALSQLNRGAEERGGRPIPSDLRESGALEQDADVILFVYREIDPADQAARRQPGPAELIVGKHRGGPTGIAHLYFNTPLMHFTDLADEPDGPEERPSWQDGREA